MEQIKFSVAVLFVIAAFVFVACEGPAGPAGPPGADGAWVIIESIVLPADTNTVTFDGISDEWEVLEIQAWGKLIDLFPDTTHDGNGYLKMRFNADSSESYYHGDYSYLGSWCIGYSHMFVTIYADYSESGFISYISKIRNHIDLAPDHVWNPGGSGYFISPDSSSVNRIDIFKDDEDEYTIAAGSEFILLGLDVD